MTAAADGGGLESGKEYMRIIGSVSELTKSGTIESGPRRMKKSRKKLMKKYKLWSRSNYKKDKSKRR